jgi:hypothetical protein
VNGKGKLVRDESDDETSTNHDRPGAEKPMPRPWLDVPQKRD